jgi:hypothetical protein
MPLVHHIPIPFDPAYPRVLAVCCSDGRYIEAVGRFLAGQGVVRHDLLALPGGPGVLCQQTASAYQRMVAAEAFEFLVDAHRTERLILIGHHHCGYYKQRLGRADEPRQMEDLCRVREAVVKRRPALAVELYFARPAGDDPAGGFSLDEVPHGRA